MTATVIILPVTARAPLGRVVACRISPDRFAALEALAREAQVDPAELAGWYLSEMLDSLTAAREVLS